MPHRFDFAVEALQPVHVDVPDSIRGADLMSPYCWRRDDGRHAMLVRVVSAANSDRATTGAIWYGEGEDGEHFTLDDTPAIAPGPDPQDIGGCEDPTLIDAEGRRVVYYTGVAADRAHGELLYAEGSDIRHLEKRGVALASSKSHGNTKEATVQRTADGRWRLFYEYAHGEASLIGLALGKGIAGPWTEQPPPFEPRPGKWDGWHLSTGPMLTDDPDHPVMFYNGATRDARWRIGWAVFDRDCTRVVQRCIEPLIVPPPPDDRSATDIAFAASLVIVDNVIWLYYALEDRKLMRARIRRLG